MSAAGVSVRAESMRDVILFRVDVNDGKPHREFEISEEALEDLAPEEILVDLSREQLPERLLSDHTMRLFYSSERTVPHFEKMTVSYDGSEYRVIRDSHHSVRVFDSHDQLLRRLPSPLPVLAVSIFGRSLDKWFDDIRAWRDAGQ